MPRKASRKKKAPARPRAAAVKRKPARKAKRTKPNPKSSRKLKKPKSQKASVSHGVSRDAFAKFLRQTVDSVPKLKQLLAAEKGRRGVGKDHLVFIGIHNLAQYYWCAYQSLWKSQDNELEFFAAYLQDRLTWAYRLGKLEELPKTSSEVLSVGDGITVEQIWSWLEPHKETLAAVQRLLKLDLAGEGDDSSEKSQYVAGRQAEALHAETHPTFRWNFPHGNFVVVGVPDGLTDDSVYEFKSTGSNSVRWSLPVAEAQADLYGFFFGRPKKIVEIKQFSGDCLHYQKAAVDAARAAETLRCFGEVSAGKPAELPVAWKCSKCEYRDECEFVQS